MASSSKLVPVVGVVLLLAGCSNQTPPQRQPTQPETRPAPAEPPAPGPQSPGSDAGKAGSEPAPEVILVFRAERDVVPIRPGGEARVKLLSVPKEGDLTVSVEPPDSRLNATADRGVLIIRVGEDATGESVVTVKAGKETARVTVKVEAVKK